MAKVLILNTNGLNFEGISLSIISYLEAMNRTGIQFDIALVSPHNHEELIQTVKAMGCCIYKLPSRSRNPLLYFLALKRLIQSNSYDIVHAHGNSATLALEMWAAKWAGCKVRISHSRNTRTSYPVLDILLRPFFNRAYTHGFACGREAGEWLFGDHPFRVIANGKKLDKFAFNAALRTEVRRRLKAADQILIGHAGAFNQQKNHGFLIKVFKELADMDERYVLYLMGDGELRPIIEQMVEAYGLKEKVVFTGWISNMAEMLQAMDIMILPSKFEGLPNVVVEWQIAGLPSIISDSITQECKATELVSYMPLQAGPAAWADKIRSLEIINREEAAASICSQIAAAGFDIDTNARQLREVYFNLFTSQKMPTGISDILQANKKIIFISNEVGNGGAGRVISILAGALAEKGHAVQVCAYHKNDDGYPLHHQVKHFLLHTSCSQKQLSKLNRMLQLRRIMKKNPEAVFIAFEYFVNMQTIIAGTGLRNRIIISERNDPARQNQRIIIKFMRNWLYRWADVLVCQTPDASSYFPDAIQKKAVVIANPVKEGLPLSDRGAIKKEIVSFGRLEKQKNLSLLIEAFALLHQEHPDYMLSIYGSGSEKLSLEYDIARLNLSDFITLHESAADIHERIMNSAMYVSSSDYEGLSNSMIEAMALGLPCIATDCPCGGARMMIRSYENGILVPVRDEKALFQAMKYIIENPQEAAFMSRNAARVNQDLAADKVTADWEQIISGQIFRKQRRK